MSKKKIGLLLVVFVFCMSCSRKASTGPVVRNDQRVLVDMVGRQVVVPKKITRVLGMSPMGTILIYTLSPDLLAGWNYHPDPGELAMVEEKYRNLPVLGGWYGKNNTGNLEEIVKAHPDVLELFYQVFDKGHMEDGEGREIDFKNTIIILTTNAGTDTMAKLCADPETMPGPDGLLKALKPELNKIFKPAFLGRMVLIPYLPIRDENLRQIIRLKLGKIQRRMQENHKIEMSFDPALVQEVANRCTEVESGARNVDNILTNTLLPDISRQLLSRMAANEPMERIHVGIGADGAFEYR